MNEKEDRKKKEDRTETKMIISQKKKDHNKGIKTRKSI